MHAPAPVTVAQLAEFDEIIDVRSESEYALDHIPDAINCPVLNDGERAEVGTLYAQVSPFDAKKVGAAKVSRNIAYHLEQTFAQRPRDWRPLCYCWRGGTRSAALTQVLQQIGWRARQLQGGYKAYRKSVIADLEVCPQRFKWHVICGLTGSGKSRLLRALARAGAQALDLEALAAHRGSVLGDLPDKEQPTQKMFESTIWQNLRKFDAARPVFVEAESKKVGNLRVPETLIESMWKARCIRLDASMDTRVDILKNEYSHFASAPDMLAARLRCLAPLHGHAQVDAWLSLVETRNANELTAQLLEKHYDPSYTRSMSRHYANYQTAIQVTVRVDTDEQFDALARQCLDACMTP